MFNVLYANAGQNHAIVRQTVITLILMIFLSAAGQAQNTTAIISGYVTDRASGEFLIGANVLVVGTTTGTITNTSGFYSLPNTKPGELELRFSFIGYTSLIRKINIKDGQSLRVDVGIEPEVLQSEEIVVEGKRSEEREEQVQTGLVTVQPLEVNRLPKIGENDLFRALKMIPGVKSSSEISAGLYIRGGAPDQNLIMLDGNTVYNPNHLFGFFSTFNMDAVKDIRLVKGGFSAENGGKMSAVVDVTNKDGNRNEFHGTGGVSLVASRLMLEAPLGSMGSAMISGRRTYVDILVNSMEKTTEDPLPDYYFYDLTGKVNFDFSSKDKLTLSTYLGSDDLDFQVSRTTPDHLSLNWGNRTYSAKYGRIISDQVYSRLIVSGSRYRATALQELEGAKGEFTEMIRDYSVKNDWDYFASDEHSFKAGLFYTAYRFEVASEFNNSFKTGFNATPFYTGGYLQDNWKLTDQFMVQFGLRYNYFSSGKYSRLEPRLSSTYYLTQKVALKAAWGTYHQYTNLLSLGMVDFIDIWTPVGDGLPPGKATQTILGIEFPIGNDISMSVEGYYKDLDNVVETRPNGELDLDTLSNSFYSGTGRAYGIEFFIQKKVGDLTGWLGYSLSRTERTIAELNKGNAFPPKYDRLHDLSLTLSYALSDKWRVGANFVYATGQAYTQADYRYSLGTPDGGTIYVGAVERNNYRLEPYHRLDLSVTRDFEWFGMQCDASLNVFNAYNHRNVWFRDFDGSAPNRPTEVTDIRLLPLLPTLELNFRF